MIEIEASVVLHIIVICLLLSFLILGIVLWRWGEKLIGGWLLFMGLLGVFLVINMYYPMVLIK